MSWGDETDDCAVGELDARIYESGLGSGRQDATASLLEALSAWNLATWNSSREPDAIDLRVEEMLARQRWQRAVWEATREGVGR